jgi:hypothetical protein
LYVYFWHLCQESNGCGFIELVLDLLFFLLVYVTLFFQYHAVFATRTLWHSLKSGIVLPSALLFLLSIALAIQGLLYFHVTFRIIFCIKFAYHFW